MSDYPGKGDAWADFLHHRARVIVEFMAQGKSAQQIARELSMDPTQVTLIFMTWLASPDVTMGGCP